VFVLQPANDTPTVTLRTVQVGDRSKDQVEILGGLNPGEQIVVRSDRPLSDGQTVRLSILSDPTPGED
jgi:HlyD family secretion protein